VCSRRLVTSHASNNKIRKTRKPNQQSNLASFAVCCSLVQLRNDWPLIPLKQFPTPQIAFNRFVFYCDNENNPGNFHFAEWALRTKRSAEALELSWCEIFSRTREETNQ
jgi:hypothetical protein